ncbi:MAG: HD domain-containing phosphohydrolase [Candidatus Cloacimonas sp.]
MENIRQHILVVDDDIAILDCIRMSLKKDISCQLTTTSDSLEALDLIKNNTYNLVIADINMPNLSGFELLEYIGKLSPNTPVILITGSTESDNLRSAIQLGASDILRKPFVLSDLHIAVNQALQKNNLLLQNEMYRTHLEHLVQQRTKEVFEAKSKLEKNYLNTIHAMVNAMEASDEYIRGHSERVTLLSIMMGKFMGLDSEQLKLLRIGALLHDLGKLGIYDTILNKKEALTKGEYEMIKQHPVIGADIIRPIGLPDTVYKIILQHHEWFGGSGYPYGLAGNNISPLARIVTVADSYDAMTSKRAYRKNLEPKAARKEVMDKVGVQFDPEFAKLFFNKFYDIIEPLNDAPATSNLLSELI